MIRTVFKLIAFLFGLVLNIAVQRLLAPRSVFTSLSVASLVIAGAVFTTPFWQQLLESFFSANNCAAPISPVVAGMVFVALTILFAWLSHRFTAKANSEKLIDTKAIGPLISISNSHVYCYCGTVLSLSEAELVVTSENTELDLGSLRSTSMSGRMRRAAAIFHVDGRLLKDHLSESVAQWKNLQGTNGPFPMGTCFVSPAYNAAGQGIKEIIHAIAIEKNSDGTRTIDGAAVRKIVAFTLNHCKKNNYRSIFIPVFGIGSSRLSVSATAPLTVIPLIEHLRLSNHKMDIYLGTYRTSDAALVGKLLLEASTATY